MYQVVIVEDEKTASDRLLSYLAAYEEKSGLSFKTKVYRSAEIFLSEYDAGTDIVLMDIELEDIDGMSAAEKLRKIDPLVVIIFVTNMAKYAIKGYSVAALDYLLKPVSPYAFSTMMSRAVESCSKHRAQMIYVRTAEGTRCVPVADIDYVEVRDHRLTYHVSGASVQTWGTLKEAENLLGQGFSRSSSSFLIALKSVRAIEGADVIVGTERLPLSRNFKKDFMRAMAEWMAK